MARRDHAERRVQRLALGADGLKRFGLPDEGLRTFPYAFLTGLTNDARARILGDTGNNAAEKWRWGQTAPHAAVLVYGKSAEDVRALETVLAGLADAHGARVTGSDRLSDRHRIIRQYVPQAGGNPGLFFMCLNGDLERHFEFEQQTWLGSSSFHGLSCEKDPLLGDAEQGMYGFTIPSRYGPVRLSPVPAMVATRGAGYFFLPGKRLLDFLAVAP